jgi:hypothetical protein
MLLPTSLRPRPWVLLTLAAVALVLCSWSNGAAESLPEAQLDPVALSAQVPLAAAVARVVRRRPTRATPVLVGRASSSTPSASVPDASRHLLRCAAAGTRGPPPAVS